MKTILPRQRDHAAGYTLLMVMGVVAISLLVLAATMRRTGTVALLNHRNNTYVVNVNAAEATVEKVYARLAYDFTAFGLGGVTANLPIYRTTVPTAAESAYWSNFQFSDGQGNANRTYVHLLTNYSGDMPSQYPGLFTKNSPVYRIVSNARNLSGGVSMTNAAQVDVLLALVPLSNYAIFYNSLLEFSTAETMTINGRVHANANIYTGSGSTITFNDTVTTTGTLTAPKNNGQGPWTSLGVFKGTPKYTTNLPALTLTLNMTNTHSLIDLPPAGESPTSSQGQQRLYNQAQVVLLVSNTMVTARIQASVNSQVPGADSSPLVITSSTADSALATNFPFLSLTNRFVDQREDKTIVTTQIDVGKYGKWLTTNSSILSKFPVGSGTYPTILFAADNRANSSTELSAIRLTNGAAPPRNGGLGWSVATPNPLYVLGNYNATNNLASTNTTSALPAAFMSDALTILSDAWKDATSFTDDSSGPMASVQGITINAAILTGIVPSSGNTSTTFSGGVHNLPRLLEDWDNGNRDVWLNTSIISLFSSTKATGKFVTPGSGSYYTAPERHFSFDLNFLDPAKQPPGMPCALVPIRYNWAVPPPNTVSYHVAP